MESRWVYREIELGLSEKLRGYTYPHTLITQRLRHEVLETKDLMLIKAAGYISKVAWAAGVRSDNAIDAANKSLQEVYDSIPYVKNAREVREKQEKETRVSVGEQLMLKFIKDREKKRQQEDNK